MKQKKNLYFLGISDSHDSGACLINKQNLLFAVNEERYSGIKNDNSFPVKSIKDCLNYLPKNKNSYELHIGVAGLSRFEREIPTNNDLSFDNGTYSHKILLISYLSKFNFFQITFNSKFILILLNTINKILFFNRKNKIKKLLKKLNLDFDSISFFDHHLCHTISAYSCSPFEKCFVLSNDGMGDGLSSLISFVNKQSHKEISKSSFASSLAMIYGYISDLCGFKKNRHNGKTTGLAALGNSLKTSEIIKKYIQFSDKKLVFNSRHGVFLTLYDNLKKDLSRFNKNDLAAGIQKVTDDLLVKQSKAILKKFNSLGRNICLVGGLHANVLTNYQVFLENKDSKIFVFPNMTDGGLSIGSASLAYHKLFEHYPKLNPKNYYLGPETNSLKIEDFLNINKVEYIKPNNLNEIVAEELSKNKIVARFHGRMEFGPRALGNRSILYSAADKSTNSWLNKKLGRTETMPFAPVIIYEESHKYIENFSEDMLLSGENMTMTFKATPFCIKNCPAAVHVDNTLRPQILKKEYNPVYYDLIKKYHDITGIALLINTSFNLHEHPIVIDHELAYKSFQISNLDILILNEYLIRNQNISQ